MHRSVTTSATWSALQPASSNKPHTNSDIKLAKMAGTCLKKTDNTNIQKEFKSWNFSRRQNWMEFSSCRQQPQDVKVSWSSGGKDTTKMGTELVPEKSGKPSRLYAVFYAINFRWKERILLWKPPGKCPLKKNKTDYKTKFVGEKGVNL
jgi:hypothetical protein